MSMTPYNNNFNWFKRFFDRNSGGGGNLIRRGQSGFFDIDPLRQFEEMEREMNEMFDRFNYISKNSPKELVREYETSEGDKVREVGPIVYGYSMSIGSDGRPKITEFGNIKHQFNKKRLDNNEVIDTDIIGPQITAEREPLADVSDTDSEVKVVIEMPGVRKENIKINVVDEQVEVVTDDAQRKYHKTVDLPEGTDIESAKSTYNNGILEINFKKKKKVAKAKGKEIKID
jgi:HSP20 family protein